MRGGRGQERGGGGRKKVTTRTTWEYIRYFAKNYLRQTREHLQPIRQTRLTIVIILEVYGLFEV